MAKKHRRSGWWYPWLFVAFFAVVFAANGIMIYLAEATFPGLSAEDAYRTGLAYDKALAEAKEQKKRGWSTDLRVETGASRTGHLTLDVTGRQGDPVAGLKVRARVRRPGNAEKDFDVTFHQTEKGRYVADTRFPDTGQWELLVAAGRKERVLYRTMRDVVID